MSTMNPIVYVNGAFIASGPTPPDTNVPSRCPPPGVTTQGCWCIYQRTQGKSADGLSHASTWIWIPLPAATIVMLQTPKGALPAVFLGSIVSTKATATAKTGGAQALYKGPWLEAKTDSGALQSYQAMVLPSPVALPSSGRPPAPNQAPAGLGGGTWTLPIGASPGLWVYDNGQAQTGSALPIVLGAIGVAAAGGAMYFFM